MYNSLRKRRYELALMRVHGATKWQRGISREQLGLEFVEVIELHPELLSGDWNAYAAFVLHHEFIHALGFHNHDAEFRHGEG